MDPRFPVAGKPRAGSVQFGESRDVVDLLHAQKILDGGDHCVADPLRAQDHLLELEPASDSAGMDFLGQEKSHGGGAAEDRRLQIQEKCALQVQVSRAGRDGHRPELLGSQLETRPGRPQPVPHADLHPVLPGEARHLVTAGEHVEPVVDVLLRVAEDLPLPRCPGGGVDPHDLPGLDGEQGDGIPVAQVLAGGEGEPGKVLERPDLSWGNARFLEFSPVEGGILPCVGNRPLQPSELERGQFPGRCVFRRESSEHWEVTYRFPCFIPRASAESDAARRVSFASSRRRRAASTSSGEQKSSPPSSRAPGMERA